ncbi:MAG: hypothetical protein ACTSVV_07305, partial [Promethearchaeota archaeon]
MIKKLLLKIKKLFIRIFKQRFKLKYKKQVEKKTNNEIEIKEIYKEEVEKTSLKRKEISKQVKPIKPLIDKEKLKKKKSPVEQTKLMIPVEDSLYLGNNHYQIFYSLICQAKKEVKIITNSLSYEALMLICSDIRKDVQIKIITSRMRGYSEMIFMKNLEIKSCKKLHAKLCLID